jgi:hypothetical protein
VFVAFQPLFSELEKKEGLPTPNHINPHTLALPPFLSSPVHLPNQKK